MAVSYKIKRDFINYPESLPKRNENISSTYKLKKTCIHIFHSSLIHMCYNKEATINGVIKQTDLVVQWNITQQ